MTFSGCLLRVLTVLNDHGKKATKQAKLNSTRPVLLRWSTPLLQWHLTIVFFAGGGASHLLSEKNKSFSVPEHSTFKLGISFSDSQQRPRANHPCLTAPYMLSALLKGRSGYRPQLLGFLAIANKIVQLQIGDQRQNLAPEKWRRFPGFPWDTRRAPESCPT